MTRRRDVTADEMALWLHAMRGATPLPERERREVLPEPPQPAPESRRKLPVPPPGPEDTGDKPPKRPAPQTGGLDAAARRRMRRGRIEVDGRVDLHGLRQSEAHGILTRFIAESQAAGRRCVLVITGKGGRPAEGDFPRDTDGVLRRQVPLWLRQEPNAARIFAVEQAHPRHGGGGALYVFLRKAGKGGRP